MLTQIGIQSERKQYWIRRICIFADSEIPESELLGD
jgi:hypothetical protein